MLSNRLMKRIHKNYRFIVTFNAGLILLGVGGILQPTTSALLHIYSLHWLKEYGQPAGRAGIKNRTE